MVVAPDLRAKLLPFTISNARAKRFYAQHWSGHDVDAVTDVARLPALPTLSKEQYRRGFMLDFDDPGDSHYVSHSTGTTGALTWRHRTLSEAATVDHLFGAAIRADSPGAVPRVALVLTSQFHGMQFPIPGGHVAVPAATYGDHELRHCVEMLQMTYHVHGHRVKPTAVVGTGEDISVLVQALHERAVDRAAIAIEAVFTGEFVDAGMRRFIESAFGVPLSGRYSLSEILGGASYDRTIGAYRLDPYVIGELVDEAGEQLPAGEVGELVLTELFPLVQMQPLIRYRTGDIVARVEAGDDFAFVWWGRRHETVARKSTTGLRWRFGHRHVADLLAAEPSVARYASRPGVTTLRTTKVGNLRFDLSPGDGSQGSGFDLTVWLRDAAELGPDGLHRLATSIETGLHGLDPDAPLDMRLKFEPGGDPVAA